jgi:hypothetical protein
VIEFVEVEYRPTASTPSSRPNHHKETELCSLLRPVISGLVQHSTPPWNKITKLQKIREEDSGDTEVTETTFV